MDQSQLTELFRKLGAQDPEGWAHSQIKEGFPQLARYLFLRQAWRRVIGPEDRSWIAEALQTKPTGPGGGIVPALTRLLAAGANEQDLTTVVRVMQWQLLAGICVLLEDPGDVEPPGPSTLGSADLGSEPSLATSTEDRGSAGG